jgi:hypothetical protein
LNYLFNILGVSCSLAPLAPKFMAIDFCGNHQLLLLSSVFYTFTFTLKTLHTYSYSLFFSCHHCKSLEVSHSAKNIPWIKKLIQSSPNFFCQLSLTFNFRYLFLNFYVLIESDTDNLIKRLL